MVGKKKGINAERELIHMFWAEKWAAIRVAGSGSSKYPSPDILAGNNLRKLAIECKAISGIKNKFDCVFYRLLPCSPSRHRGFDIDRYSIITIIISIK